MKWIWCALDCGFERRLRHRILTAGSPIHALERAVTLQIVVAVADTGDARIGVTLTKLRVSLGDAINPLVVCADGSAGCCSIGSHAAAITGICA